ncbi:tetratricopeptide repeat protein [Paraburkholderia sp. CI3]|uniref:CHAT domain-containing tetratricopeptide repeat protein n=1 Tax=Paraburkholderia sp. CI3 TaxID=2991060 RepID=UPI003D235812
MLHLQALRKLLISLLLALAAQNYPLAAQLSASEKPESSATSTDDQALDIARRARALASEGQYVQAIALGEQALAMVRTRYGPRHEYVAYLLDDLATWHYQLQRFDDAVRFSRQAVEIITEARGAESTQLATLLRNLASIDAGIGQSREAALMYEKSYAIFLKNLGPNDERSTQLARNLGVAYLELSRFDAAEKYLAEALRATRAIHGQNSAATARAYLDFADVKLRQESTGEARNQAMIARRIIVDLSPVDSDALAAADVMLAQIDIHDSRLDTAKEQLEKVLHQLDLANAPDQLLRASVLYNLGWIDILRRQVVEAEGVYKDVLSLYRRALSERHPSIGRTLHCLAIVYKDLGRFGESERLYQRAIDIFTASFGEADASVAATRLEYSSLLSEEGHTKDAIAQARAALSIYDRLPGDWDLKRGYANSILALAEHRAGDLDEAGRTYTLALSLMSRVRGESSSDLPSGLTDLARIYRAQGRLEDAGRALDKAVLIREKDGAATPAGLAESLAEMANLRLAQGNPQEALVMARRAVKIAERRLDVAQRSLSAAALGEQQQARGLFEQFLEIAGTNRSTSDDDLRREMFEVAQLPHLSGTAGAISQMAVRFSAGNDRLAVLVRQRQDTVERWRALDRSLIEGLTQTPGAGAGPVQGQESRQTLVQLSQSIEKLDDTLRREFPEYSELTNPRPVSASAVQKLLKPNEALLLQVTSAQATYLFFVTGHSLSFARTNLDSTQLQQAVDSLRKGLDLENVSRLRDLAPFDVASAYLLYQRLLQPFRAELRDEMHIVAVVDRSMQNLPLSVLLATPVDTLPKSVQDFGRLDFLSRHFAFSIEPSVSSFTMLRAAAKQSHAPKPFIAFGDPVLQGTGTTTQGLPNDQLVTGIDPALLRTSLPPLPDTRYELTTVAHALKASDTDLYFGTRATKLAVMHMDLAAYRIVAFATHGVLAGEFRGVAEPALVLTPPATVTSGDNGLLTASDIATLRLDADWVLLSACNTAAPEGRAGAEGLSGLAKAFFFAGSRALLVSHWAVESEATSVLMVRVTSTLAENPDLGRAEALRRTMLSLLDGQSQPKFAHPAFWAPFVNVGEGGRN